MKEEYEEIIQDLIELINHEIARHYEEKFIAGLDRAKEIMKDYFEIME